MNKKLSIITMSMVTICLLAILPAIPVTVLSTNGTTEVVSTASSNFSEMPSLAVDSNGNVHVAWTDYTDYLGSGDDGDIFYKNMVPSITLTDLMTRIDALESKIDHIEWKLDILLERLGIVVGLMLPTEGLKLVIDLFINNAADMVLGILLLIGFSLLMRRVKKKV